jgi:hypothetical protein
MDRVWGNHLSHDLLLFRRDVRRKQVASTVSDVKTGQSVMVSRKGLMVSRAQRKPDDPKAAPPAPLGRCVDTCTPRHSRV